VGELEALKARVRERVTALIERQHWVELDLHLQSRGIPALTTSLDEAQLQIVIACCRAVEDAHSYSFHPDDAPALDTGRTRGVLVPSRLPETPTAPTEGAQVDQATLDALANRFAALSDAQQAISRQIVTAGERAGRPFGRLTANPTERRFEIARALLAAIEQGFDEETGVLDEPLLRAIASAVLLDLAVEDRALPLGEIFGSLTIEKAKRLCRAFESIGTDSLRVVVEGDAMHISGSALAAD
jgi:hypothetical protein